MQRSDVLEMIRSGVDYPVDDVVDLGDLALHVRASVPEFPALRYFSRAAGAGTVGAPRGRHMFYWVSPDSLRPSVRRAVRETSDRTFRAQRFAQGFYLTHHHGAPADLFVEPEATYVVGGDPEKVLWSYLVKVALTQHAWRTGQLHLKAGAIVADGRTILVVGRGGGGKTFFTLQAAGVGSVLLSNTHVLLTSQETRGVATSIRVRPDVSYDWLLRRAPASPHFEGTEMIIDPIDASLNLTAVGPVPSAILIMNYTGGGNRSVTPVRPEEARPMIEHFAWPMNVYGMKYDVWEMVGAHLGGLRAYVDGEGTRLDALVHSTPSFCVDWTLGGPQGTIDLLDAVRKAM